MLVLTITLSATSVREVPFLRLVGGTDVARPVEPSSVTVAQFCAARGLDLSANKMALMGKAAAMYSRTMGLQIDRATDGLFGEVNAYCVEALEAISGVLLPADVGGCMSAQGI